jgi:hypothetical protein
MTWKLLFVAISLCTFGVSAVDAKQPPKNSTPSGRVRHHDHEHGSVNGIWSGNSSNAGPSNNGGANYNDVSYNGNDASGNNNVGGANAHDPTHYCHWYASDAVNQARAARASSACSGLVNGVPSRWSLNYQDHYGRCLSMFGSGQNASEHQTRAAELERCLNQ